MSARALAPLVVLLVLLAAGPLVAPLLPAGPGGLLMPDAMALAAAGVAILFALLLWPTLARERSLAAVAGGAAVLLVVTLPFVAGLARAAGVANEAILNAGAVVAGCVLVAGVFLAGPGRDRRADRWFVAGGLVVVLAGPLANYALSEFGRSGIEIGYRVSPLLAVRRILLDLPDADPLPFLLLAAGASALMLAGRMFFRVAPVLLLAAGATFAQEEVEVHPLLGEYYVPGRPVPLLVKVPSRTKRVEVGVPGHGTSIAEPQGAGASVLVPGASHLARVEVRIDDEEKPRIVPVALKTVPPGRRWFVTLGPTADWEAAAQEAGVVLSRVHRGGELYAALADGVLDPTRGLDDLVAAARRETITRRVWEEPGRELDPNDLHRLFPPRTRFDPVRSRRAFLILLGYGLLLLVALRYSSGRGLPPLLTAALIGPLGVAAVLLPQFTLTTPASHWIDEIRVREGGRGFRILRFAAVRDVERADIREEYLGFPQVLGPAEDVVVTGSLRFSLDLPLRAHQTRLAVVEESGTRTVPDREAPFDLLLFPEGLARPGEAPRPVVEFLRQEMDGIRAKALPKLLRLGGERVGTYGIRFKGPGVREIEVVRVE